MLNKTRAEYRQAIRDNLDDQSEKTWTNNYLNRKIEEARDDICNRFFFRFLEGTYSTSTTTASNVVNTPNDFDKPLSADWSDGTSYTRPLRFVLDEKWRMLNYTSATTGVPHSFTNFAGEIKIYPRSAGVFRSQYKRRPVPFSTDSGVDNAIPLRWGHVVEDWATAVAWEKDEEFDNAARYWSKVETKIRLMKQEEGESQMGAPIQQMDDNDFMFEADPRRISNIT